jgi:hypothetical protein
MEITEERFARLEAAVAHLREKDASTGKHANHVESCTWMFSLH